MSEEVPDAATARDVAEQYAREECVGEFGEVLEVREDGSSWVVEYRTHTFADAYDHSVRITKAVGNVVGHERSSRFD